MIKLGKTTDGTLVLGGNETFPAPVKYIEYYRQQRLFNLVFETPDEENSLMPCELPPETALIVQSSPNIMVIAGSENGGEPYGYVVPLVQIGI